MLIGLPALRLSGLYLALITLMAAGAITVLLTIAQFPNGGDGFFGNSRAGGATSLLTRPAVATSDTAYYRYCVVVAGLMFLVAVWHVRGKAGRAWAAIRQSQATAVAAGVNTMVYKLWAFALAVVHGRCGRRAAGRLGRRREHQPVPGRQLDHPARGRPHGRGLQPLSARWSPRSSSGCCPPARELGGWSGAVLTILFGVGVLQVLLTAPGGLVEQFPRDMADGSGARSPGSSPARARGRSRRSDRRRSADRPLRWRHPHRRDDADVRCRHLRADRPERRRQDDVLQRAERLRQADAGQDLGLRRRPAGHARLQARPLGPAAHVPDRAGHRQPERVRQRAPRPRAHRRRASGARRRP